MKKIYLFGNWKMNQTIQETETFAHSLSERFSENPQLKGATEFCIFPPFLSIARAVETLAPQGVRIGAQNVNDHESGAYTGEVSPYMLAEAGCTYALIGHSERRHIYGETSELVNLKALNCLSSGIIPVVCVGETLDERLAGKTNAVVKKQLMTGIQNFELNAAYLVAYEPVWAIGTGKAASASDAEEVCAFIKSCADVPAVLYGGSVKPSNAAEIFSQPSIDGGLIGGASLKAADYFGILAAFRNAEAAAHA
ncbi:MAG: triose-phosphate isomerase [Pyramidobacter sp.]|nr:triose-phosphate isomerase [Pyramidobacter sp.]